MKGVINTSETRDSILSISQKLAEIIEFLTESEKDYIWHKAQVDYGEKKMQDLLHCLELDDIDKNQKNRIATELRNIRRSRRAHKDLVQLTQPIAELLQSEKGKQMYNLLREAQGKAKKVERYHANRQYWMRVPTDGKKNDSAQAD